MKDPYAILGVDRRASADEIKRAFRKLAKQHHPDRNKNDQAATARFQDIQQAYAVLSDPKKRAQFDQFGDVGAFGPEVGAAGPGGTRVYRWSSAEGAPSNVDIGDLSELFGIGGASGAGSIFEQFFGGRTQKRGRRTRVRPADESAADGDVEHEVTLDFEQALRGTTLELSIQNGDAGAGRETIQVRVPSGVEDGQRIRVRGKGRLRRDGSKGDVYLKCRIRPHRYFRRHGDDIYLEVPITIGEAVLGAKVTIPTLSGPTNVTIPPGTASGKKLRLAGCGVLNPKTQTRGDQYAVIRIVPPQRLTERQRKLMEEFTAGQADDPRAGLW